MVQTMVNRYGKSFRYFSARIPGHVWTQIEAMAERDGVSKNEVIVTLLKVALLDDGCFT